MARSILEQAREASQGEILRKEKAPALEFCFFGPAEAWVHGRPLPALHSRKGWWLLALLALRGGRPVERSWLAGTLWPESNERFAYSNLRRCLNDLRYALTTG